MARVFQIVLIILTLLAVECILELAWPTGKLSCDELPGTAKIVSSGHGMNTWKIERFASDIYIACDERYLPK